MRFSRLILLVGLAAACSVPGEARAQERPGVRVIISAGGGRGSAGFSCEDCPTIKENAPSGYFRVGRLIRPDLMVGGQVDGWVSEQSTTRTSAGTFDAFAMFYPRQGFFVTAGAGMSVIRREQQVQEFTASLDDQGIGFHAGAGYEFQIATHVAVNAFATYFGTAKIEFSDLGSFNANVFVLGLGVTLN